MKTLLLILLTLLTLGSCRESKVKVIEAKVEITREGGLKDTLVVIEPYEVRYKVLYENNRPLVWGEIVAYDVIQVKRIK